MAAVTAISCMAATTTNIKLLHFFASHAAFTTTTTTFSLMQHEARGAGTATYTKQIWFVPYTFIYANVIIKRTSALSWSKYDFMWTTAIYCSALCTGHQYISIEIEVAATYNVNPLTCIFYVLCKNFRCNPIYSAHNTHFLKLSVKYIERYWHIWTAIKTTI